MGTQSVRSTGVEVMIDGKMEVFNCSKEVVLAAGVYNTPKILELSGIGAQQLLQKHGISTVIDLPGVGENLQDHLMTGLSYEVVEGVLTGDPLMRQEPDALALAQKLYVENKAGPFTIGGMQSHAFMPTPDASTLPESVWEQKPADFERQALIRSMLDSPGGTTGAWLMFLAQTNLHEGGKSFVGSQLLPENYVSLGCIQSHPLSRGSTHISSADITDGPNIDPRYLSHPADIEILARHLQSLDTVLRPSTHLSKFLKPDGKRNHPDAFKVHDLKEAKKYVVDTATSAYHSCGTAAMMPLEKGGVVSPELMVYGTSNLQIVDASIFPLIPRGNILSSVYAVAERASDIIKGL
ncbi:GMC oxidoreductase-domain-containing protein [Nemania serpens]|nr:GMC oxidoreductase-domain-containing protein [Nemania serpens]